ncbi:MAG: L-threonine 3-dehydrogenase [Chlamydiae bacterium GWC2_50_10]|nr:MAG: L-threonine 3-dehydrogenase [Chlamydiae bacterium GWC2_50_10]OGN54618.1 MAG: L-threonine 3-dehydrogenase [Chlamydiae bacterium GWF2_49_8]OGN57204.1 MAG: L-threonine 3-dehydrogenase [Chlamydiae bacterium RIFCSPHIGHO2_02_FULL_49_29]OGN63296.1 MAG: L-threonine 3-dehydrogenase [Chlamydiae bacterium RIFCSPHIGHO2_12_FULL_49_32]OGN70986.1 MAG: L-threonine 3-dehydrogenase [Chlamydiae bacterium RIFCSPLOWO2_02_FULL_49_12]HCJ83436.1 L-threonine 3-dehydrogenase [Parachlamydiales bacterium]
MKALGKLKKEKGLWLYEAPMPSPGPHDLLIRVQQTGICGTDIHIYEWDAWAQKTIPVPMTVGHEFVGIVEKVGTEVKNFQPGDRVSGEGHLVCGACRNCRAGRRHLCSRTIGVGVHTTGCFADYFVIQASNAIRVPKEISDTVAAIFDPLGNAVHTALSFDLVGEDVLITGAGPIGIMAIAIALHAGARRVVITELNPYRLALAAKMHPTRAVDLTKEDLPSVMKELGIAEGFGVGLEMSGHPAGLQQMIDAMRPGGKIALLGILPDGAGIDWTKVIFKGLVMKGIYGREMYETWYKMLSMLQSGLDISAVATHHFPAGEFQQGFDLVRQGKSGKVILDWR